MDIIEAYREWTDSNGLVHPIKNPTRGVTQNGIRWTSEAYIIFHKHKLMTVDLRARFWAAIKTCEYPGKIGLYNRCDNRPGDQEGPDDYHSLIGACGILGLSAMAKEILEYGQNQVFHLRDLDISEVSPDDRIYKYLVLLKKHLGFIKLRYNYNNANPEIANTSSFMGRFPALIACMKYACNDPKIQPTALEKTWLIGAILFSCRRPVKEQDQWALTHLMIQAAKGKSRLVDRAIKHWFKELYKVAPGGMKEILLSYFGQPEYPTVQFTVD